MEKEAEEIRKFWIDPQTNRAWDIFADSSETLGKAKRDIPALLSALEAAQTERDQANEAVRTLSEGKPLGPLVESHTIINQAREIKRLTSELEAAQREYKEFAEGVAAQTLAQDERETALEEKLKASQREIANRAHFESEYLKQALRDAILKTKRVKSICIEADPAGNRYEVDWLPHVQGWAKLANLDLEKHDPTWYQR